MTVVQTSLSKKRDLSFARHCHVCHMTSAIEIESASRLFTSLYTLSIETIFDPPYLSLKIELERRFITNLAFTLTVSVIEIETIKHRDFRLSYVRFACLTLSSM